MNIDNVIRVERNLEEDLLRLIGCEPMWNMLIQCNDGSVGYNRLVAGLVFPQLTDEDVLICPDYKIHDVADQIDKILLSSVHPHFLSYVLHENSPNDAVNSTKEIIN